MMFIIKIALFLEALQLAAVGVFRACLHPRHRNIIAPADVIPILAVPLGLFGHDKNVFYAALFVMPLFWAGNPVGLAKRYVLMLVLFPDLREVYAIGNLYLAPLSSFTAYNLGALVALAVTRRGRLKPVRSIDAVVWILFVLNLLLVARGEQINGVLRFVITTFLLVVPPYYIVARAIGTARAAGDTVSFIVLGGLCNALVALFESVKHWSMYQTFNQAMGVQIEGGGAFSMRAGLLRAGGAVANYEVLGLVCGLSLLAAITIRPRFTAAGFQAVVVLLAGGLFVSQARSAWIATLAGVVLHAAYERRWRRMAIVAGVIGFAGALSLVASSGGTIGELLGKGGHAETTGQYRETLLSRGLEEAARHPLTGQTLPQLEVSMNDLRQGEHIIDWVNTHLLVMLVAGVVGLALWLIAWGTPMVLGWRRRRRVRGGATVSVALPFASLGMTFLFLTFTSPVGRIMSLVAIGMGLMSVCVRLSAMPTGRPGAGARPSDREEAASGLVAGLPVPALPALVGGFGQVR